MNDLISVIIPVKNGSKYISQAIEGIKSQKMNTEIIIADDCSEDDTIKIAERYGCRIIKNETNRGQVAGKNNGIKAANGRYILFHDHDDIMRDNALNYLYKEIISDKDISAVEAKVQDFYSPELTEEEKQKTEIKKDAYWGLFTGAILMKKEIFDKIGLFNENVYAGEILEWQSKMEENGLKIKKIDFVSTNRQIHSSNFGKLNQKKEFKDYAAILRARLKNRI